MKPHKKQSEHPRFRIQKLEERIAPKKTCIRVYCYASPYSYTLCYNPHGKLVGPKPRGCPYF